MPISNGMFWPAWQGWIADVSVPEKRRAHLSLFCVAWSTGIGAGLLIGGAVAQGGLHWAFFLSALLGALTTWVVWPERGGMAPANEHELKSLLPPVQPDRRWMLLAWLGNSGTMFSVGTIRNLFPKLTVSLGMPAWELGALVMLINAMQTTVFYLLGRWPGWQGNFRLVVLTQLGTVVGMAMLGVVEHPLLLAVPMLLAGMAAGLNFTLSMSYSVAGDEARGLRAGLHEAVAAFGGMTGPVLSGVVVGRLGNLHAAYPFCGGVVLLALVAQQIVWRKRRIRK